MKKTKNKFAGCDDIYVTRGGKLAAKKISTYMDKNKVYHKHEKTRYYQCTAKNLALAKKVDPNLSKKK